MTKSNWSYKSSPSSEALGRLIDELKIDKITAHLLAQRGIHTFEQAKKFFRPSLSELYCPFLMKGMQEATVRILQAIERNEKVCIYGDYDVDGITSVALVYDFLKPFLTHLSCYVPHREKEGYGISFLGIDEARNQGVSLLIALDCGIKDAKKVTYAKEKAIDIIICDHHLPSEKKEELPKAFALLNPKQEDCPYPFKELSGCGIGFKLIEALGQKLNLPKKKIYNYLDLVALSIAADIVPMVDENRILAFYGLLKINQSPSLALQIMTREIKKEIEISDLVFSLAPKINAAGRITHAKAALNLLISKDEKEAQRAFEEISDLNIFRKNLDQKSTLEAIKLIQANHQERESSTVLFKENWHRGILGIMASRLIETYYRPTIVFTESNGMMVGSARSIEGFNIYEALRECSEYISQFGGHKYAAGLSIEPKNFKDFEAKFKQITSSFFKDQQILPPIKIDCALDFDQITPKFLRLLKQFGPFGPGNMRPVFCSNDLLSQGEIKVYPSKKNQISETNLFEKEEDLVHLKMKLAQKKSLDLSFSSMAFNTKNIKEELEKGDFEMVFSIKENYWNGKKNTEFYAKDFSLPKK